MTQKPRKSGSPLPPEQWPTSGPQLRRRGKSLRDQLRPDSLPFKGNRFSRWLGWTVFRLHGWDLAGQWPQGPYVMAAAAPHTCNFDGWLAIWAQMAMNVRFSFFIKKDVFVWPFGYFWHWMGGVPVDRSKSQGLLEAVQGEFEKNDKFVFAVTPEGTRHPPKRLKSGIWRLSKEVGIPLTMVTWDFDTRTIWMEPPLEPTETFEEWELQVTRYWDGIRGGTGYFMGVESPNGRRLPDAECPRPFTPGKEKLRKEKLPKD